MRILPPPNGRWTHRYKEQLIKAAGAGDLHVDDLLAAGISVEEFAGWLRAFKAHGHAGLKSTRRPDRVIRPRQPRRPRRPRTPVKLTT